jgi:hypothetical protein
MEIEQHPCAGQIDIGDAERSQATILTSGDFRSAFKTASRIVSALM